MKPLGTPGLRELDRGAERPAVVHERRDRALEGRQDRPLAERRLAPHRGRRHRGRGLGLLGGDRGHHHDVLAGVVEVRLEVVQRLGGDGHLPAHGRLPDVADLGEGVPDQRAHRDVLLRGGAPLVGVEVDDLGGVAVHAQVAARAIQDRCPGPGSREASGRSAGTVASAPSCTSRGNRARPASSSITAPAAPSCCRIAVRSDLDAGPGQDLDGGLHDRGHALLGHDVEGRVPVRDGADLAVGHRLSCGRRGAARTGATRARCHARRRSGTGRLTPGQRRDHRGCPVRRLRAAMDIERVRAFVEASPDALLPPRLTQGTPTRARCSTCCRPVRRAASRSCRPATPAWWCRSPTAGGRSGARRPATARGPGCSRPSRRARTSGGSAVRRDRVVTPAAGERAIDVDQSNDSVVVGDTAVVKFFVRTSSGPQPASDLPAHLAAVGFAETPPLDRRGPVGGGRPARDGRRRTCRARSTGGRGSRTCCSSRSTGTRRRGPAVDAATRIGGLVGRLHRALATPSAVLPAPVGVADAGAWLAPARSTLARAVALTPGEEGRRLRALVPTALDALAPLGAAGPTPVMRIHGDLHVGQILRWEGGEAVGDLDGNPLAPIAARSAPDSPARDVAAMARAIDHVGRVVARRRPDRAAGDPGVDRRPRAPRFLEAYRRRHRPRAVRRAAPRGLRGGPGGARVRVRRAVPPEVALRPRRGDARPAGGGRVSWRPDPAGFLADLEADPGGSARPRDAARRRSLARRRATRSGRVPRARVVAVRGARGCGAAPRGGDRRGRRVRRRRGCAPGRSGDPRGGDLRVGDDAGGGRVADPARGGRLARPIALTAADGDAALARAAADHVGLAASPEAGGIACLTFRHTLLRSLQLADAAVRRRPRGGGRGGAHGRRRSRRSPGAPTRVAPRDRRPPRRRPRVPDLRRPTGSAPPRRPRSPSAKDHDARRRRASPPTGRTSTCT